jgi:hypothetical protein
MRNPWAGCSAILTVCLGLASGTDFREDLRPVSRDQLCVTEGALADLPGQRLAVEVPKMRAYLLERTSQVIEAHIRYLGGTSKESPLGSGEMRRQFGFKLRAQDPCNLVYVMWRIEPESKVVVSVKRNPSQHTSAECGNAGYTNIRPQSSHPILVLREGAEHILRAELTGPEMRVFIDNKVIWEGTLPSEILELNGPVGIRSDNAHVEMKLLVPEPGARSRGQGRCDASLNAGILAVPGQVASDRTE